MVGSSILNMDAVLTGTVDVPEADIGTTHGQLNVSHTQTECRVGFQDKENLNGTTEVNVDLDQNLYRCTRCAMTFANKSQLDFHSYVHMGSKEFLCVMCGKSFHHKSRLQTHMRFHAADLPYACTFCDKKYLYKYQLDNHLPRHSDDEQRERPTFSQSTFQSTSQPDNRSYTADEGRPQPFTCTVCQKGFSFKDQLYGHMQVHHAGISNNPAATCSVCNKIFATEGRLRYHSRTHAGLTPFQCTACQKSFVYRHHLNLHVRYRHVLPSVNNPAVSCIVCNKIFATEGRLRYHSLIHAGLKPFQCTICQKNFVYKHQLDQHVRGSHLGIKPYACEVCKKRFAFRWYLMAHSAVHSPDRPYSCSICKKTYLNKSLLKMHACSGIKPYACKLCSKRFAAQRSLTSHSIVHNPHILDRPYSCTICQKTFCFRYQLKVHARTHSGIKPYDCELCGKSFAYQQSLMAHSGVHSLDRPYSCTICQKTYKYKTQLYRHNHGHALHNANSKYTVPVVDYSSSDNERLKYIEENPYQCAHCSQRCSSSVAFKQHISKHFLVKSFGCGCCGRSFQDEYATLQHMLHCSVSSCISPAERSSPDTGPDLPVSDPVGLKQSCSASCTGLNSAAQTVEPTQCLGNSSSQTALNHHDLVISVESSDCVANSANWSGLNQAVDKSSTQNESAPNITANSTVNDSILGSVDIRLELNAVDNSVNPDNPTELNEDIADYVADQAEQFSNLVNDMDKTESKWDTTFDSFEVAQPDNVPSNDIRQNLFEVLGQILRAPSSLNELATHSQNIDTKQTMHSESDLSSTVRNSSPEKSCAPVVDNNSKKPDEKHVCGTCQRSFPSRCRLNSHKRSHLKGHSLKCPVCQKSFASSTYVKIHERMHGGEKPYSCTVCNRKFYDPSNLSAHKRIHARVRPQGCNICQKRFISLYGKRMHRCIPTGEKPYSCTMSDKRFVSSDALNKHKKMPVTATSSHVCMTCDRRFKTLDELNVYMMIHTPGNACDLSEKHLSSSNSLQAHNQILDDGELPLTCHVCPRRFRSTANRMAHMRVQHMGKKPYGRKYCDKLSAHTSSLVTDLRDESARRSISNQFLKPLCPVDQPGQDSHQPANWAEDKPYACVYCRKRFSSASGFKVHFMGHISPKSFACNGCQLIFRTRRAALAHVLNSCSVRLNLDVAREPDTNDITDNVVIDSDVTDHTVIDPDVTDHTVIDPTVTDHTVIDPVIDCDKEADGCLPHHLSRDSVQSATVGIEGLPNKDLDRTATSDDKQLCSECGLLCTNRRALSRHVARHRGSDRAVENSQSLLERTVCQKMVKFPRKTQGQLDVTDCVQRPYRCKYCNKRFRRPIEVSSHLLTVHGGYQPYHCRFCSRRFSNSSNLLIHTKTVHGSGKSSLACFLCDMHFASKNVFAVHLRKHSESKPHRCQNCDKCFSDSESLDLHMATESLEDKDCRMTLDPRKKIRLPEDPRLPSEQCAGDGSHSCDKCHKVFASSTGLKIHSQHYARSSVGCDNPERKRYCCQLCEKTFLLPSQLQWHSKLHDEVNPYACPNCHKVFSSLKALTMHSRYYMHSAFGCSRRDNQSTASISTSTAADAAAVLEPNRADDAEETMRLVSSSESDQPPVPNNISTETVSDNSTNAAATRSIVQFGDREIATSVDRENCDKCERSFAEPNALREHILFQHNSETYCAVCHKDCTDARMLRLHMLAHAHVRLYACRYCDKRISRPRNVKQHEATHFSFACPQCELRFKSQLSLTMHKTLKHGGQHCGQSQEARAV